MKNTTITVSRETHERLSKLGRFGESHNKLLDRLLKELENK